MQPQVRQKWYRSLRLRVVAFLSLALLPVGLIAVSQTRQVTLQAKQNTELALLALTEQSAISERRVIQRAFGAANLLGTLATTITENSALCVQRLQPFVTSNPSYSFVGIIPVSGWMTCSSSGQAYDFSDSAEFDELMANPRQNVLKNETAPMSGVSVIIVSQPYFVDGQLEGFVSISIPHDQLADSVDQQSQAGLRELVTFNPMGSVLTAKGEMDAVEGELPGDVPLTALSNQDRHAFTGINGNGEERIFTVVPVVDDTVYVLGVWDDRTGPANLYSSKLPPAIFPALMWITSLLVALFAVHRLAVRHIRNLGRQMNQFARSRMLAAAPPISDMPVEIAEMQQDFTAMAETILQDEAQLENALHDRENALRDKNVLLKEVHHRVKNNLQLISSIMNMQIRKISDAETKITLRRLQDRVLSLATIHRDLYQSQHSGRVNVGALVREIVDKTVEIGSETASAVDLTQNVEDLLLFPDQAVPLSLLVSEAMTNAMKYLGAADGMKPRIRVQLTSQDTGQCTLLIVNSMGGQTSAESTGLGAELITAFATQLGATVELDQRAGEYAMTISFQSAEFVPETRDY